MLSLVAALACVIAPSPHADDMSLPEAMSSSPRVLQSLPAALPNVTTTDATPEMMTPLVIECAGARAVVADCSTQVSRDDEGGSCLLVAAPRGQIARLQRGHAHDGTHRVAAGVISPAPELLAPDAHDTPLLRAAGPTLPPPTLSATLHTPPQAQPPEASLPRIDRPPRA